MDTIHMLSCVPRAGSRHRFLEIHVMKNGIVYYDALHDEWYSVGKGVTSYPDHKSGVRRFIMPQIQGEIDLDEEVIKLNKICRLVMFDEFCAGSATVGS